MSIKKKKQLPKVTGVIVDDLPKKPLPVQSVLFPFMNYQVELIVLLVLAFILYVNTLWGNYVLDDVVSITGNRFVQHGIAGIAKILTTDSMHGFNDSALDLQGGRYRPFPLIIFAIEHQLWGNNPHLNHLVTLLVWILAVWLIYNLLRKYFFAKQPDIAFISTLVFIVHPIHTEVVANIKSVDEIYSLMFLISSVTLLFKYITGNKNVLLYIVSLLLYFIALFSKEYGLTFLFIIPLMIYIFTDIDIKKNLKLIIPYH